MKPFVAHYITRNNIPTLNIVHLAANELLHADAVPKYKMLGQAAAQSGCQTCEALKLSEKNKLMEVEGARDPVPHI